MSYVPRALSFLLLLLSSQFVPLVRTVHNLKGESDRIKQSRKVTVGDIRETTLLDKPDRSSWNFLLDQADILKDLSPLETSALNRLERLGVRIYSNFTNSLLYLNLNYERSILARDTLTIMGSAELSFHESYSPYIICSDDIDNPEHVWNQITLSSGDLEPILKDAIDNNWLLRATIILEGRPELIANLSSEFFAKSIFVPLPRLQGVHKFVMMEKDPETLMNKFLEVYSMTTAEHTNSLAQTLLEVLIDLKVTNDSVRMIFNILLESELFKVSIRGGTEVDVFPILSAFVASKRPLTVEGDILNEVLFSGAGHENERVSVLNLDIPIDLIEQVVLTCFGSRQHALTLMPHIVRSKQIISKLSMNFLMKSLLPRIFQLNDLERVKMVLSDEFIETSSKIVRYEGLLGYSINFVDADVLEFFIGLKLPKNRFPFFNRKSIVSAACKAILLKRNELFIYLLEKRHFVLNEMVVLKQGGVSKSLLAVAFEYKNYELIRLLESRKLIKWSKFNDLPSDDEAQQLIMELNVSSSTKSAINSENSSSAPVLTSSPPSQVNFLNQVYLSNIYESPKRASTFYNSVTPPTPPAFPTTTMSSNSIYKRSVEVSPEIAPYKRLRMDPVEGYEYALLNRNDSEMLKILKIIDEEVGMCELQERRDLSSTVWELYDTGMLFSLNFYLKRIVELDQIHRIALEAVERKCEYVLFQLIKVTKTLKGTERIGDRNIIAHLLKTKQADLAFKFIHMLGFNIRHSDSPTINPEGDIILSAAWDLKLMAKLLKMGASPHVYFQSAITKEIVSLLQWAEGRGKTDMIEVLSGNYNKYL